MPLRVAVERPPYADLIAHAKESLDAEVCGVLVGQFCEDDEGLFVHVEATIRGSAATQAATHVTFTQATWEAIHQSLERDHRGKRIVGWYHTHPGFGVEFSEMDLFIQRNFFPGAGQIALVTDPMNGAVAIAVNAPAGIKYLERFWVDAREQLAKVPASAAPAAGTGAGTSEAVPGTAELVATVRQLEARVGQLLQAHDEHRTSYHRLLYMVGFMVCLALVSVVGYFIYSDYSSHLEPPRLNSYVPVPVQVGDKTVMIGVGVAQWDVPPELNAMMLKLAKAEAEAAKKRNETGDKSGPVPDARTAPGEKPAPSSPPRESKP